MTQETVDKVLGVEGVQNLVKNEAFYAHLMQVYETIVKQHNDDKMKTWWRQTFHLFIYFCSN